jgi:hypothetical protein
LRSIEPRSSRGRLERLVDLRRLECRADIDGYANEAFHQQIEETFTTAAIGLLSAASIGHHFHSILNHFTLERAGVRNTMTEMIDSRDDSSMVAQRYCILSGCGASFAC